MDQSEQPTIDFTSITADIVSSYVANNSVHRADLAALITSVHAALQGLVVPQPVDAEKPQPAVSIRKSVTPDYIISLEDGKRYKTLRRHLGKLGLTPDEYRSKWGLPRDYPMVAPNYAQRRSELAKSSGLGQIRSQRSATKTTDAKDEKITAPSEPAKAKRRAPAKKSKASAGA